MIEGLEGLEPETDETKLANIRKFQMAAIFCTIGFGVTVYLFESLDIPRFYASIPVMILAGAFGYAMIRYLSDDEAAP